MWVIEFSISGFIVSSVWVNFSNACRPATTGFHHCLVLVRFELGTWSADPLASVLGVGVGKGVVDSRNKLQDELVSLSLLVGATNLQLGHAIRTPCGGVVGRERHVERRNTLK